MKLHAFGDSFVVGDQDQINQDSEYLKYHVSFASLIAQHMKIEFSNWAQSGTGNYSQLDLLTNLLQTKEIKSDDLILFGITSTSRDRCSLLTANAKHIPVINQGLISDNWELLQELDHLYILSILDKLTQLYDIRIIKFNLFYNPQPNLKQEFSDYLGPGTLINIINDTWGELESCPSYHGQLIVPSGYEKYYTAKKHPSVAGHKKIADWFTSNIL